MADTATGGSYLQAPFPKARASVAGSTISTVTGFRKPVPELEFSLTAAKNKAFKALPEGTPGVFKSFFYHELYDRLLHTCILYFVAVFQREILSKNMERAQRQHLDGFNPQLVETKMKEAQEEAAMHRMALSPLYAEVLLTYSTYQKPQQDRKFFESLLDTLAKILCDAFGKLNKQQHVQLELGQLFRSKHFNQFSHGAALPRSVDTLSVREIYAIKHEAGNRALNAKLISSLFERPNILSVQVASVTNSPLITQSLVSPIVARSYMKDPENKRKPAGENKKEDISHPSTKPPDWHSRPVPFSLAQPSHMQEEGACAMDLSSSPKSDGSSLVTPRTSAMLARTARFAQTSALVLPEAAGLFYDENFNYLVLLRRYVLYGPTLGLTGSPPRTSGVDKTATPSGNYQ